MFCLPIIYTDSSVFSPGEMYLGTLVLNLANSSTSLLNEPLKYLKTHSGTRSAPSGVGQIILIIAGWSRVKPILHAELSSSP